jgi:hypothetical protein
LFKACLDHTPSVLTNETLLQQLCLTGLRHGALLTLKYFCEHLKHRTQLFHGAWVAHCAALKAAKVDHTDGAWNTVFALGWFWHDAGHVAHDQLLASLNHLDENLGCMYNAYIIDKMIKELEPVFRL